MSRREFAVSFEAIIFGTEPPWLTGQETDAEVNGSTLQPSDQHPDGFTREDVRSR